MRVLAAVLSCTLLMLSCRNSGGGDSPAASSQTSELALNQVMDESLKGPYQGYLENTDLDNSKRTISYFLKGKEAFFEGDIELPLGQAVSGLNHTGIRFDKSGPDYGVGITWQHSRWPNATIPYEIEPGLVNEPEILSAIAEWQEKTVMKFKKRTTEEDYVYFTTGTENCSSYVGRIGGRQEIHLSPHCNKGTIIHELGHAVGLFHEQSRSDRDEFITIAWDNIEERFKSQFEKEAESSTDFGTYDVESIMHYGSTAFSKNEEPTIVLKNGESFRSNRLKLSAGDIQTVKQMYSPVTSQSSADDLAQSAVTIAMEKLVNCQIALKSTADLADQGAFVATLANGSENESIMFNQNLSAKDNAAVLLSLIPRYAFSTCEPRG